MGKRVKVKTGGLFDDLKDQRYRIEMDESFYAEQGHDMHRAIDPWLEIVVGTRGHLYVHNLEKRLVGISYDVSSESRLKRQIRDLCVVTQDGADGINAYAPERFLPHLLRLCGARKVRPGNPHAKFAK